MQRARVNSRRHSSRIHFRASRAARGTRAHWSSKPEARSRRRATRSQRRPCSSPVRWAIRTRIRREPGLASRACRWRRQKKTIEHVLNGTLAASVLQVTPLPGEMMKAVMRELAQAKRHYSKLPLFEFLRSESIPPRDRLAFYPCMAPFILAFSDLNRFVLREETSKTRTSCWSTNTPTRTTTTGRGTSRTSPSSASTAPRASRRRCVPT